MKIDTQDWFGIVERLRHAEALWPEDDLPVEIKQTHISVILLGKHLVLKLKKPVDFGFLDYTTPEKRQRACELEVELNRRLCPEIYLGTQPVIAEGGEFHYSGSGAVVDYGVLMKRLPEARMLESLVSDSTITESDIVRIAEKVAAFHKTARRGPEVDRYGSLKTIRFNWQENFDQTAPYIDRTISSADFTVIRDWVHQWLEENEEILIQRVKRGHICDGHGDLRCESICVTNGICIFDCIEFNERFRCSDVANEAAFLAMDLAAFGRPDLGYFFFERYSEIAGDEELFELFPFYRCYRAFVRGKVLSFQLDEPEVSTEKRALAKQRAEKYFRIALASVNKLQMPTIVAVVGLSGTGKTSVARALGGDLGMRVVSSDAVRKSLFGENDTTLGYGEGIYSPESSRLTYQEMIKKGVEIVQKTGGVILDATFLRASHREEVIQKAASVGAQCRFIECRLAPEEVRRRLNLRAEKKDGLSDATLETYEHQIKEFEPIEDEGGGHLVLDTETELLENSRRAAEWLLHG